MIANRIKIVKNDINKFVNIPVNMQWDFMGRDDSISEYETKAIKEVTGIAADFEVARFSNNIFQNFNTDINYEFNFYDDTAPITANTIGNWSSTYLNEGFSVQDVYYFCIDDLMRFPTLSTQDAWHYKVHNPPYKLT